jgi:manganese oxidase
VHGHPWLMMPYVTSSTVIGNNPTSPWMGTRGGVGPSDHFDALVLDNAGGKFNITGDYLYRSYGGPRMDAGIWGLIRVLP